jgi:hypothetical protein
MGGHGWCRLVSEGDAYWGQASNTLLVSDFANTCLKYALPGDSPNIDLLNEFLEHPREHKANIEAFLCQSSTFARAKAYDEINLDWMDSLRPYDVRQASARMHAQYGMAQMCPRRSRYRSAYGFAASMVYDLRNYKLSNFWGPFRDTGDAAVDWEKMEAVMIVLSHNLSMYRDHTGKVFKPPGNRPFLGATPNSYVHKPFDFPHKEPRVLEDPYNLSKTGMDPYNISGTWMRVSPLSSPT